MRKIIFLSFLLLNLLYTSAFSKNNLYEKIDLFGEVLENIKKDAIEGIVAHKNLIYDDNIDNLYAPLLEGKSICPNYILNHTKYLKLDKKKYTDIDLNIFGKQKKK